MAKQKFIRTQVRFSRLMEELDAHREELSDLGGEYNELQDNVCNEYVEDEENPSEDQLRMDEIDVECEAIEEKIQEIREQTGLPQEAFDRYTESIIMNRWEVYASLLGAEVISLVDIANGRA